MVKFVVVEEPGQPAILGLPTCQELDLIRLVDMVTSSPSDLPDIARNYEDVFEGLGRLSTEHGIKLKLGVEPAVHTTRWVPFRLREPVGKKLST